MILLVVAQVIAANASQPLGLPMIITYLIFGITPLLLGFVLWHRQPEKRTDHSLRDLAKRLSTVEGKSDVVINTIDDGVMAINKTGLIDLINPSAQTLVGWDKGDALGLDWRSVLKLVNLEGREVAEDLNPIAQALNTNSAVHTDKLMLLTQSDRKRQISITVTPVSQGEGGVIMVFRDITKEKAEEREQAEFISTASHEMRTPVASIEGYLGLALNPATAQIDDKARDYITKAHQSARHLGELFQNLLDISKAEDGRLKNEPQVIDVAAMTGSIFESLEPLAKSKQLRYFFKPNPSFEADSAERRLQPVFYSNIDPSHFRELVGNLIENAIKYTPAGEVIVDVGGDEKLVTVSVQDTGIGIPSEDLPHLFQKFYRVDNSDTREIGGTGLGLYLSRKLAEAMGGHLRVESEYKKGSTFFLDIPRLSHEEAMRKLNELPETPPVIELDHQQALEELVQPAADAPQATQAPQFAPLAHQAAPYTSSQQPTEPTTIGSPSTIPNLESMTLADVEDILSNQPPIGDPAAQHIPQDSYTPPVVDPQATSNPDPRREIEVPPRAS
ncbi:hypothetical protein B7Y94_01685 [Candidatus Saccharibacteria bacterium 32-49-12]|nr:MAG: hypothetical protein B7Y94_01685 [Candidatus Saccharibacteria bacterium 32-49-12]